MNQAHDERSERSSARDRLVLREHQLTTREFVSYFASVDTSWTVLDIGCGDGFYLEILRNLGFQQIYGMDEDAELVEIARSKGLRVVQGSVYDLEAHEQLDAVVMCDLLNRLEDPGLAITRVYSALKRNGIFYLTAPVVEPLPSRFWTRLLRLWSRYEPPERPDAFNTDAICWLLRSHKFEVENYVRTVANTVEGAFYSDQWLSLVARKPAQEHPLAQPSAPPLPTEPEHEAEPEFEEEAPTVIETEEG